MDATTERLVDYAQRAEYATLPPETVKQCKRRIVDTFASAIGAYDEPLSRMARQHAARYAKVPEATVWGSPHRTTSEAAAFANGVMLRYLDISDTYLSKSRGHPSDTISGILAAAEELRSDGASIINAITLSYDIYCSFMDAIDINSRGWDQPVYSVLGCVLGVSKLMGLTREQMGHAISLALVPNMALTQTRRGELSSWKGCAGANAARNAVFAATLARDGFTGPAAPFDGEGGLFDVIGKFDWPLPAMPGAPHMITLTHIKTLPICYHGQSAVLAALELRPQLPGEEIAEIQIETYRTSVSMMGADESRWTPSTRETADHSLPYVVATALLDGRVNAASFAPEKLGAPRAVGLMRKIKVSESTAMTQLYPESSPSRLVVRLKSGQVLDRTVRYPKGHAKNPVDDAAVAQKFRELFAAHGTPQQIESALSALQSFEQVKDVRREVLDKLATQATR